MRRLLVGLAVLLAAAAVTGCHPTGSVRCDDVLGRVGILKAVEDHGWVGIDCAPDPKAVWGEDAFGYADVKTRTILVKEAQIGDDRVLIMVAGHEDGHAVEAMYGHPPDEARASTWSFCNWPQQGVGDGTGGYHAPPEGCAGWIP